MTEVEKQIKEPFAVATHVAERMGYSDFTRGSAGRKKRDEIAEELKRQQKAMNVKKEFIVPGVPVGK